MYIVSYDCTEFSSSSLYEFIFYHDTDIRSIMSEASSYRASSDICTISYDRVPNIGEVWYMCLISDIWVFELYRWSYFSIFSYTRVSSDVGIWSDDRSFSEIGISLYIGSWFENHAFFEVYISFYGHIWFDNCSFIDGFRIVTDDIVICIQEIPWISDSDPSASGLYYMMESFSDIDMDEISDLEFSSRGEGNVL